MNNQGRGASPSRLIPKNMGKYYFCNGFATSDIIEFESEEQAIKACEKNARSDNHRNWLYELTKEGPKLIGYACGYGEWKFFKTGGAK